jgi:C4-dicarboxylate-specific signal transduction histidine kinase
MQVIKHMSRTIDDFRNFFSPDKEKVEFRVSKVIASALSLIGGSLSSMQVHIEADIGDDPVITGYQNEYAQVILNILTNARDAFAERKVEEPKVTISAFTEKGKTVMTIRDNAGGIPIDSLEKIFDPYFTTKDPDKGTGLGLFMSKTIIEKNMDGRLTARNNPDGAEFRIEV